VARPPAFPCPLNLQHIPRAWDEQDRNTQGNENLSDGQQFGPAGEEWGIGRTEGKL